MSKLLEAAQAIGARYALIVKGENGYIRFYKPGTWETSRNCMLYWNEANQRWDNSSELSFSNIELGMRWTNREYDIIDFVNKTRRGSNDSTSSDHT